MDIAKVDQIIDKHNCETSSLIKILLDIQNEHKWLPKEAIDRVAGRLHVPFDRIHHLTNFYKAFSLAPKG